MNRHILPILRCPASGAALTLEAAAGDWIDRGTLISAKTGQRYPIIDGLPHLYVDDQRWEPKAREARGWVQLFKDTDGFVLDDGDFTLPYHDQQPWIDIARQFDIMLSLIDPRPGDWVLDIGAGRGWAAKQFAVRGCHTVAVDVVADTTVGLGRSRALMQQANVTFDALIADGENLPLIPDHFDIVFCAATLHHATNLPLLLRNIQRILRPGGRLVAINEPCIADATDDEQLWHSPELVRELSYGINETRPRLHEYRKALNQAELREESFFLWNTHGLELHHLASWSTELGILSPQQLHETQPPPPRWQRWLGRQPAPPTPEHLRRQWCDYVIQQCGGVAIIIAQKASTHDR